MDTYLQNSNAAAPTTEDRLMFVEILLTQTIIRIYCIANLPYLILCDFIPKDS